jgi:5-methylcytosine-specific restriction endonuclease McrA
MSDAPFKMRGECKRCGCTEGRIESRSGQDCVYCLGCGAFQYNAPKTETGRAVRSIATIHNGITGKQRQRILARANTHCELCGAVGTILNVGHLLSAKDGFDMGLSDAEINSDENLAAFCEQCNSEMGKETVSLRLVFAIIKARARNRTQNDQREAS